MNKLELYNKAQKILSEILSESMEDTGKDKRYIFHLATAINSLHLSKKNWEKENESCNIL